VAENQYKLLQELINMVEVLNRAIIIIIITKVLI